MPAGRRCGKTLSRQGVFSRLGFIWSATGPTTCSTSTDRRTDLPRDALAEITALVASAPAICKMGTALKTMDPTVRKGVEDAIAVKEIPATAIAAWLRKEGLTVSDQTVLRHRKETCACRPTKT